MRRSVHFFTFFFLFCLSSLHLFAQAEQSNNPFLKVGISDIRLEKDEGGWHLYIRHKKGTASILLTETTKDPEGKATNYAFRAPEFNPVNGNELRILNGDFLESDVSRNSIIDSSLERDEQLGRVFHLYIPKKLQYGYPWTRHGEIKVKVGTFINIRTFEKAYGDYSGAYADNPFMFDFIEERKAGLSLLEEEKREPEILTDEYSPYAAAAFNDIASGIVTYSRGPASIVEDVLKSVRKLDTHRPADVVFAIDATGSMWDDIATLQKELVPALTAELEGREPVRLGLLFYRDYTDNFRYRGLPVQLHGFQSNETFFEKLNEMHIPPNSRIGGDTPEAVYEALYASLKFYKWDPAAQRKIILIGDAEPHPSPRGRRNITKQLVEETAQKKDITIDCIIIPDGKAGKR